MKKQWIPFLMLLLVFQTSSLISIEESYTEIARGGGRGGGGVGRVGGGGRAVGARPAAQRTAISNRGVGSLQRTPSLSRARAYRAGQVVGAAAGAAAGATYYGGYAYPQSAYYYPNDPYYYFY